MPSIAVAINNLLSPFILSMFLNRLQSGTVSFDNSLGIILIYAASVFVGEVIIWRIALYACWTFETKAIRDLLVKIFGNLSRRSMQFHSDRFGGSLVSQSNKLVSSFERFWDVITWNVVPMITMTIGAIIIVAILGFWQYAVALAVISMAFAVTVIISSRFMQPLNLKEARAVNKNTGFIADMITNTMTVKAFGNETYETNRFKTSANQWFDASQKLKWGVVWATGTYSILLTIIRIMALVFAVYFASTGMLEIGTAYLLLVYTLDVSRQLWEINGIVRNYSRVIGDAHDMTEILNTPLAIVDHSTKHLQAKKGAIRLDTVSFTHDNGKGEQVFSDFSLSIHPGERIGIVGRSGSGKTTLVRILLRFSDIQAGTITIDGQNIAAVTQQSLHESIAFVPQEPLLFHRSLAENIAYSKPDADKREIAKAAALAHADEFIEKLPDGFDTIVGERGIKLSGGQRQRIAIARALLKDAPILVLDEATSALDSESEKLIQASLETLMKGRTSIVIAHRLSTISKLDRIIVLDKGQIIEDGTHVQLLQQKGVYAKLWSHQSGGFIEE
ncbi:MAG TPA: ABC transporter ATP-binding protein [Candidatus Saccharibacteria bacterium]|nr:ABC transporter ATP-binding protein [Candidatus Saccharibacteria bacterium]HMR38247.1 ABC transporter ATP-binding protein [Candidatus Saccharibacteria bacterium]